VGQQRGGAGWPANPQEKKMDENFSKAASNIIEMKECQ